MLTLSLLVRLMWYGSIVAGAVVLVVLLQRRIAFRYPLFWIGLVVKVAVNAHLAVHWFNGGLDEYGVAFLSLRRVSLVADVMWATGAFMALSRHARRFAAFGTCLFIAVGGIATAIVFSLSKTGTHRWDAMPDVLLFVRNVALGCSIFLFLILRFFHWTDLPLRSNTELLVKMLMIWFLGELVGNEMGYAGGPWLALAGSVFMYGCFLVALFLLSRMDWAGEAWTPPPEVSTEEFERGEVEYRAALQRIVEETRRIRRGYWMFV